MKKILLLLICFTWAGISVQAQTYKENYAKCGAVMKGVSVEDPSFFSKKDKLYACLVGSNAPDFSVKTLEGKMLQMSKLKGQVVVLNFWNTGCKPCIEEMPALNEIVARYKNKNVTFISIAPEDDDEIKAFLKKREFNFLPVANAAKLIKEDFITDSIYPYTMIIDQKGKVKKILIGGTADKQKTFNAIMPAINECLAKK